MKIRTGFVSNSSSSNFIVAFPRKPKSIEDTLEMMFGTQNVHYVSFYGGKNCTEVDTLEIAESVFRDIKENKRKATKKQMIKSLTEGYFSFYEDEEMFPGNYSNHKEVFKLDINKEEDAKEMYRLFDESSKINKKRATAIVEFFMSDNQDKWVTTLAYADEDGNWGSILEHTGIFDRLEHIKTSCH